MLLSCRIIMALLALLGAEPIDPTTTPTTKPAVTRSEDGTVEITVPHGWKVITDQRAEGDQIFIGYPAMRYSCRIKTFMKEDMAGTTLADYEARVCQNLQGHMTDTEVGEPKEIQVGNNRALQREVRGVQVEVRWVYQCTVMETPKLFICVYCCTVPSKFARAQASFNQIVMSVRDTSHEADQNAEKPASGK